MGWAGEKLANEIVGLSMATKSVVCGCGKRIVQLKDTEFWRLDDSGEVCRDGHWHKPAEVTPPKPVENLCEICDSQACTLSANGKYYCSQDRPSWQEEEVEVIGELKPAPQAEHVRDRWALVYHSSKRNPDDYIINGRYTVDLIDELRAAQSQPKPAALEICGNCNHNFKSHTVYRCPIGITTWNAAQSQPKQEMPEQLINSYLLAEWANMATGGNISIMARELQQWRKWAQEQR